MGRVGVQGSFQSQILGGHSCSSSWGPLRQPILPLLVSQLLIDSLYSLGKQ